MAGKLLRVFIAATFAVFAVCAQADNKPDNNWFSAWTISIGHRMGPAFTGANFAPDVSHSALRMVVRPTIAGKTVRVKLENTMAPPRWFSPAPTSASWGRRSHRRAQPPPHLRRSAGIDARRRRERLQRPDQDGRGRIRAARREPRGEECRRGKRAPVGARDELYRCVRHGQRHVRGRVQPGPAERRQLSLSTTSPPWMCSRARPRGPSLHSATRSPTVAAARVTRRPETSRPISTTAGPTCSPIGSGRLWRPCPGRRQPGHRRQPRGATRRQRPGGGAAARQRRARPGRREVGPVLRRHQRHHRRRHYRSS